MKTLIITVTNEHKNVLFVLLIFLFSSFKRSVKTLFKIIYFSQILISWQMIYKEMYRIELFSGDITLMYPTFELPWATKIIDYKTLIQRQSLNNIIALNVNCPKKDF